jgi:hypothetical protein
VKPLLGHIQTCWFLMDPGAALSFKATLSPGGANSSVCPGKEIPSSLAQ